MLKLHFILRILETISSQCICYTDTCDDVLNFVNKIFAKWTLLTPRLQIWMWKFVAVLWQVLHVELVWHWLVHNSMKKFHISFFWVMISTFWIYSILIFGFSVSRLQEAIAKSFHISPEKQVLLISGGENLDPHVRVCSYSSGTVSQSLWQIYMLDQSFIYCYSIFKSHSLYGYCLMYVNSC